MKKIYFRKLMIDITRRCQLRCEHCLRGEAQNLVISTDIIDSFLEQTAGIGELFFSGGEPTLAPDRMNYFVDHMIEKGIPLGGVTYITNGVELSEEVKAFLVKAHSYITESREKNEVFRSDCKIYFQPRIDIGLSIDNFHVDNEKVKQEYEQFFSKLDSCLVHYVNNDIPHKVGRGRNLKHGHSSVHTLGGKENKPQVGMEYESHHLLCDDSPRSEEMLQFCDVFIPCAMVLTTTGKLFVLNAMSGEYTIDDGADNAICQFINGAFPSIFDSVIVYNKGRKPCYLTTNIPDPFTRDDLDAIMNYKKVHNTDTSHSLFNDTIFADDVPCAKTEILLSLDRYSDMYKSYLRQRIEYYSDIEEIKRDFPNANSYFCKELQDKIKQSSVDDVIDWVVAKKDKWWYCVDDAHFESTKSSYNQIVMNEYKKRRDKIMQSDMPQPIKADMNKELLKAAREQLAK